MQKFSGVTSTISTYYVAEADKIRSNSKSGSVSLGQASGGKGRFKALVQSAMGNVKINKSGDELYFTAPDCVKVRRRVKGSGLIELQHDDNEAICSRTVAPRIEAAYRDNRDLVFALGGHYGTNKTSILHGETLNQSETGDDVPPRSKWGILMMAMDKILKMTQGEPNCEITSTVTKIQHDHVADVLVSLSGLRLTRKDAQKTRQQYAKLLALSQGVTLDVEEGLDGRFSVSDQLDCPVRQMDDFMHVINCCAAANSGKFVLKLSNKKSNPAHYLVTIRVWRKDTPPIYLHFLEMADFDWTGTGEDTEAFQKVLQSVAEIGAGFEKGDILKIKAHVRENTLSRILFSTLNFNSTDFVYYGLTKFTHGMEMLEYMAKMTNQNIEIVLHGPDGEGDNDVDPELKEHVHHIQLQCDDLKREVESLQDEKKQLEDRFKNGEESISRLQQQCSIVKKLASMTVASKQDGGHPSTTPGGASASSKSQAPILTPAQEQRRRLLSLEKDLAELKAEDKRRSDSSMAQIRHIQSEKHRCATRTQALKKEHEKLTNQLEQLRTNIRNDQTAAEQFMNQQLQSVIDRNHEDLERRNEDSRKATEHAMKSSQLREQREFIKEQEITRQLQDAASELSDNIAKENEKWRTEYADLQKQLEDSTQRRLDLEAELLNVKRKHHLKISQLDEESKEMTEYAHRVTKALVQFEHYNSTEAKRVINFPKCNVVLYDTTAKHDVPWFQKQCARMREWLDERNYPRPAAYVDIVNNKCIILPQNGGGGDSAAAAARPTSAAPLRPTTAGRSRPGTAKAPSSSTPQKRNSATNNSSTTTTNNNTTTSSEKKDYAENMLQHLERRNNDLKVVLDSRQRLAQKKEERLARSAARKREASAKRI